MMLSEAELCPAKGLGVKGAPASWILCACYSNFVKDDLLSRLGAGLPADLGEEGLKPVIIVLTPFFVRVMMALGALEALAKKNLGNILQLFLAVFDSTIPDDRRVIANLPRCRNELADKRVVGHVVMERIPDP